MEHARMARPRPWRATGVALLVLSQVLAAPVEATSLQVAPTSLQLEARQRAGELWLTNSGTSPVKLQVRVFRWVQQDGQEQLLPTDGLVVTPPMQELADDVAARIGDTFWKRYQMLRWPQVGLPVLGIPGKD
ncbi:MAG TPA: hypothetical protein DIC54_13645 [Pseudomonas sp.]|nr:hypothetical protein [Pseudomonas sp.]